MAVGDLITLGRLKTALGVDPIAPTNDDAKYSTAITTASALIRAWTGLTLEAGGNPPTTRDFYYNRSGYLDINECHTITAVTTRSGYTLAGDVPRVLTVDEYLAYPLNTVVKLWLQIPEVYGYGGGSPLMGFTRNLDQYQQYFYNRPDIIAVTASWGWPSIPEDIQQATVWTSLALGESPHTQVRSESIEGYARTWGPDAGDDSIPMRARAILEQYIVPKV